MTENNFSFENKFLEGYNNSDFYNIIIQSYYCYLEVFKIVYESHNKWFKEIYNKDLEVIHYYINFLVLFSKELEDIIEYVRDTLRITKPRKLKRDVSPDVALTNFRNKYLSVIENAKVFLVNDQKYFDVISNPKEKTKRLLYLGLDKKYILDILNVSIFMEAEYFIRMAKHKKAILDPFNTRYDKLNKIYLSYTAGKQKRGDMIKAIRKEIPEYGGYKASGGDSFYQTVKTFINANKKLSYNIEQMEIELLNKLKEL